MNALALVVMAGLAGFWMWTVLQDDKGLFAPLLRWAERRGGLTEKGFKCPWCSGAWYALFAMFVLNAGEGIARTFVMGIAAAAITGMLGSYFGEDS